VTLKNGCIVGAGQIPKGGTYASHRNAISYGSVGPGIRFENISAYNYGGSLVGRLAASPEGLSEPVELVSAYSQSTAC
jgi:hypothetical protein